MVQEDSGCKLRRYNNPKWVERQCKDHYQRHTEEFGAKKINLTKRQIGKLREVVALVDALIDHAEASLKSGKSPMLRIASDRRRLGEIRSVRHRRSAADAERMRADVLAKRAKGVPVTKLARDYGVSTAYIYMIKK